MALRHNVTIRRWEDVSWDITLPGSGDITGWTFESEVHGDQEEEDDIAALGTGSCAIQDGPNRVVRVTYTSATTGAMAAGAYWWDVVRTDSGFRQVVVEGDWTHKNVGTKG